MDEGAPKVTYRALQVVVAVQSSLDPQAWLWGQWLLWPELVCAFFICE